MLNTARAEVNKNVRLSSSLRARSAEESLALVEPLAFSRGVSRVVDTTRLDRIGIPVYASVRPDAPATSICVNAGKGYTHAEAKIGAYMEAIEFSFAPYGRNIVGYRMVTPLDMLASFKGQIQFLDFAPCMGCKVEATDLLAAVAGQELLSGLGEVLVPAELVYHPFAENPGVSLYGSTTNGLASGNTLQEALVHGLAEVMERHVSAFELVKNTSRLVTLADAPPKVTEMVAMVESAGLRCHLRHAPNAFGMAYFSAHVLEPDEHAPISIASGFGFHPNSDIAAVRAIAEAVQGRLSYIHGGRDDLIKRYRWAQRVGPEQEIECTRRARVALAAADAVMPFAEVPSVNTDSIAMAQQCLFDALQRAGLHHVVQVPLTDPGYPFQVVKVVVPGAEAFSLEVKRVGPRLLEHVRHG